MWACGHVGMKNCQGRPVSRSTNWTLSQRTQPVTKPETRTNDLRAQRARPTHGARRRCAIRRTRIRTPTAWPDVRVKPGAPPERWPRASTRARCPVDAKTPLKMANVFLHPPSRWSDRMGRGSFRRRTRHVVGHRWRGIRRCRTRPSNRCRALKLTERPRNRGRSGPIQMAAEPEKRVPAQPVAAKAAARAKRTTPNASRKPQRRKDASRKDAKDQRPQKQETRHTPRVQERNLRCP